MKWHANGHVIGGKYLGVIEADTAEEAKEKAFRKASVHLCHQCSRECENAEIEDIDIEPVSLVAGQGNGKGG